jgi:FkbM family methyltransferase
MLPPGARAAIIGALAEGNSIDFQSFLRIAEKFNVVSLKVRGNYGVFQSTSDDLSVFGAYASSGVWASQTNNRLREFFAAKGRGTYVDVGANIGLTTIPVSQNRNVSCFALEPEPTNFANLCENIKVNCPHGNVVPLQIAAFSKKTTIDFEIASGNLGDHRIHLTENPGKLGESNRRKITVEACPLDELVPTCDGPLAVKIDTQGAEPFVVEGGQKILARADLLIMEFWPYGMNRLSSNPEPTLQYLERQFGSIMLAKEEAAVQASASVKSAVDRLRHYIHSKAEDHTFYLDVIATR